MPNLSQPLTSAPLIDDYGKQLARHINRHLKANSNFQPLLTMYLSDKTCVQDINEASKINNFFGVKWYPQGVTTNSANGVSDIKNCYKVLDKMQEIDLPLLVHGESPNPDDDVFDRERIFIETTLDDVRNSFPQLRITMEHISSKDAVTYLKESGDKTAATITPQLLCYNRNHLLGDKIAPHLYCKPILKREEDRQALIGLVRQGFERAFLGSDSAPHTKENKECSHGCAGVFSAPYLLEIITQIFEDLEALDMLAKFTSINGAKFYGFPIAEEQIELHKQESEIPLSIPVPNSNDAAGQTTQLVPLGAGTKIRWQVRKS